MIAIAFLLVALVWTGIVATLAFCLVRPIAASAEVRVGLWFAIVPVLWVVPVLDEVVGARQFEALCKPENAHHVHSRVASAADLELVHGQSEEVAGKAMPIRVRRIDLIEKSTGAPAGFINAYTTNGGWVSRHVLQGWGPWFGRPECALRPDQFRERVSGAGTA